MNMANPHDALWNRIRAGCVWVGACLVWQGYTSGGYGVITFKYKKFIVHRAVYEYFKGPIPKGFVVDHVAANGLPKQSVLQHRSFGGSNAVREYKTLGQSAA